MDVDPQDWSSDNVVVSRVDTDVTLPRPRRSFSKVFAWVVSSVLIASDPVNSSSDRVASMAGRVELFIADKECLDNDSVDAAVHSGIDFVSLCSSIGQASLFGFLVVAPTASDDSRDDAAAGGGVAEV